MKLIATKPFSLNGVVICEGREFTTIEQHGRELLRKGLAIDSVESETVNKELSLPKKKATRRVKRTG